MKEALKDIAVAFATFLQDGCIYTGTGYALDDMADGPVFEIPELYDYWRTLLSDAANSSTPSI